MKFDNLCKRKKEQKLWGNYSSKIMSEYVGEYRFGDQTNAWHYEFSN